MAYGQTSPRLVRALRPISGMLSLGFRRHAPALIEMCPLRAAKRSG